MLLHGFPDSSRLWRNQVPALVAAGFQVIVPDLRGYGASDKPANVDDYAIPFLAGDVLGVLDAVGVEKAHVVGHDWGAALAWTTAALVPDRVDHLVTLSVGHPSAFGSAGLEQREKSWYMLLFQFEDVAEQWLSNDGWAHFREWSRHPDAEEVIAELEEERFTDSRTELVPGQRRATVVRPPAVGVAAGAGAHDGRVVERRLRADRDADDRIRAPSSTAVGATSGSTGMVTGCSSRHRTT